MEHCRYFVPCQECRLALGCLGIVAHIIDNRLLFAVFALLGKAAHPRTSTFGWAAEVVTIPQCEWFPVLVNDFIHAHIFMICRYVPSPFESQSVGSLGSIKHTLDEHTVDIEVRFDVIFGKIILGFLHLCRVVEAVVGLKFEVVSFDFAGKLFDFAGLFLCFWLVRSDELFQKGIHILRCFGHGVLQRIGGIVLIPHEFGFLCAQLCHLNYDRIGVETTCSVASMH